MKPTEYSPTTIASMSSRTFARFSDLIMDQLGIRMTSGKKVMLESRLRKRIIQLGLGSYDEYYEFVIASKLKKEKEFPVLFNMVTTNKTDFFREPTHFDYMVQNVLPELTRADSPMFKRHIKIWSAACSSGEEPYTLAMVVSEFCRTCSGFSFSLLATDISTKVLQHGIAGIYNETRVEPVPLQMKKRYLMRSKDKSSMVRFKPEIRSLITFKRLNFMDSDFRIAQKMDIVFLRNVLIYFDMPTQKKVLKNICRNLNTGGHLFIGHSESLHAMDLPVTMVAPSTYKKL